MLDNYLKSFKAYDIRGVYEKDIDEKLVYILGRAIGKYFKKNYGQNGKFLIAKDVRPANDTIIPFFIRGFCDIGLDKSNINYIELCSTSISYYIGQDGFDLSVNFTASHNPPEYVGMKFFDKDTIFLSQELLKNIFKDEFLELEKSSFNFNESLNENINKKNQHESVKINKRISQLFSFLNEKYQKLEKKHKFVVDFSNGAATKYEKDFFKQLQEKGHTIFFLNEDPDGTFPNHLSDTTENENYQQCIKKVKKENAEFGIMFDGDADRLGFVLPDGQIVGGDTLLTILSKQLLSKTKDPSKESIIYEVMCSKSIKEEVEKIGGNATLHKMGRFFIKEKMDKTDAILGGETSGHFMFREIGGFEMPLLALYYIINELENQKNFKKMIEIYKKYPKSPILNKKVDDKNKIIESIKENYSKFNQETIDGVSVFGDDFWFNIRCSNTENKVRYTVEAETKEILDKELKKLESFL